MDKTIKLKQRTKAEMAVHFSMKIMEMRKGIDWIRQTVHRAHHHGPLDSCQINTCSYARQLAGK